MGRGKSSSFKGGILATCPVKFLKKWSGFYTLTFSTTLPNLNVGKRDNWGQTAHFRAALKDSFPNLDIITIAFL